MRVVLTGASGFLGSYLGSALSDAGHEVVAWSGRRHGRSGPFALQPVDVGDPGATARALDAADPDAILHAAAVSSADAVRHDLARAVLINVDATARLARWAAARERRILFTSTDLVFDGSRPWSREDEPTAPILAYGRTKAEAEHSVLAAPRGLAARLSLLFGPSRTPDAPGYYDRTLDALGRGESQTFFEDEFRTPLDYRTAALILARLVGSDTTGILHVAGRERLSRYDLMRQIADAHGLDPGLVRANRRADAAMPEPRPADVSLDTSKLARLWPDLPRPGVEEAVRGLRRPT